MSMATSVFLLPLYTSSLALAGLLTYLILWQRTRWQTPQEVTVMDEGV
jgi:hypothetical protein